MKPVVLFIEFYKYAGAPFSLISILQELQKKDEYTPVVICTSGGILQEFLEKNSITHLAIEAADEQFQQKIFFVKYLFRISQFLFMKRVNLIHVNHFKWGDLGVILGILFRVPVIIHLKDVNPVKSKFDKKLFQSISSVSYIAVSDFVRKEFITKYPHLKKRTVRIYDGIRNSFVSTLSTLSSKKKSKNHLVVGTISRIAEERGIQEFFETVHLVLKNESSVRFVFAGYNDAQFPKNDNKYSSLLANLDISQKINFVPTFKNEHEIQEFFSGIDVFLITSRTYALPNVAIESILMGKPVIAANVGGNSEVVKHSENGLLVSHCSAPLFAEEILQVSENPSLLKRLSNYKNKSFNKKFNLENTYRQLSSLYKLILQPT